MVGRGQCGGMDVFVVSVSRWGNMGQKQSLSLPAEFTVTGLDPPFSKHDDCAGLFE